jgi:hypothetical protein
MVIVFLVGGIFLGFALGFATLALLAARDLRLQCEKARETSGCSPRRRVDRAFPARAQASGASCQLSIGP